MHEGRKHVSNDATMIRNTPDTASTTERRALRFPRIALALLLAVAVIGVFSSSLATKPAAARSGLLFEPGQRVYVNTDWLNLRTGQGTSFDVINVLPYGTEATILGLPAGGSDDGYDWYNIETDGGQVGWVAGMYLAAGDDGGDYVFIPYRSGAIVDTDALNLRDNWGLGGSVIDVLPYGTEVVIDSKPYTGDGYTWYAVGVRGTGAYGWVAGDFLAVTSGWSGIGVGSLVMVNTDALNIREGAGLSWNAIDVLTYGFTASVIDGPVTVDGYTWYRISTSAITGWVAGEFLVAV